eukprot:gene2765-5448_t
MISKNIKQPVFRLSGESTPREFVKIEHIAHHTQFKQSFRSQLVINLPFHGISINKAISIGVNLSPIGGEFQSVKWDPSSTYVFIDLFKHCSLLYVRSTWNGGNSFGYQSNTQIYWRSDGYPTGLPYTTASQFWVSMCDIGAGGSFVKNGTYKIMWDGSGDVSISPMYSKLISTDMSSKSKTVKFSITGTTGINVRIMKSNYSDPVHNIRIIPIDFVHNYTRQIFQPDFLSVLLPFDHIRFTGWQKISTNPKYWKTRTIPSSQTQHGSDGVAIEHMVDLVRILNKTVKSIWFSFPLASADYNVRMAILLRDSLPKNSNLSLYYEAGSPEAHLDSDRHFESLYLFGNFTNIYHNSSYTLMPTVSVVDSAYIAYVPYRFGISGMREIKVIAVPGQFGNSPYYWDNYTSYGAWKIIYANYSINSLLHEIRRSVLVAESLFNKYKNYLLSSNPTLEIVAFSGGPRFSAEGYGYRAGKASVLNCASKNLFPCTWANTKYSFSSISAIRNATAAMTYNATLEQIVENNLIIAQRDAQIKDIYLDLLERWNRIGGHLFIGSYIVKPSVYCLTGGKACGNDGMLETPVFTDAIHSVKYSPLVLYKDGIRSILPFTSKDLKKPTAPICSPACVWGTCYNNSCVCYAGYEGNDCTSRTSKLNDCTNDTGINLAGIADWSTEWAFVDLFHTSRAWISQDFIASAWSTNTQQNLQRNGYPKYLLPTQMLGSMMMRDLKNHMRSGTFICLYDGDGIINFSMDVIKIIRNIGRIEVTIHPSTGLNNGAFLIIERTNPDDPIRNIRFIMPGFEATYEKFPFHPLFLNTLKSYKTIRFMDWANTNGVTYGNWSDRSSPNTTHTFSSAGSTYESEMPGVDIEHMILLSNTLGAQPWFNMPHMCTDDFVRKYATLVKKTLRPDLKKIYIEYSNEVWGTLFKGGIYAQIQGLKLGLAADATTSRLCYYGLRSSQIFTIWKNVFGDESYRLELVLSSQAVNPDVSRIILQCGKVSKLGVTALAIAPYFGQYNPIKDKNFDVFMNKTLPSQIMSIKSTVLGHLSWAKRYNLSLITYESGQGMQGSGKDTDFAILANRDIRMRQLYVMYYTMLRSAGVELMMQFSSTGLYNTGSSWGLIEATDADPTSSPKLQGLLDYIDLHKTCASSSYTDPNTNICPLSCSNSGYCRSDGQCECYYGFSGLYCEISTYTEHVDLCGYKCFFDQGTCVPDYIIGKDRYWKCLCSPGYYGTDCSLFDCKQKCNYNGRCLDIDTCSCYPGYAGTFCEIDCGCDGHGMCSTSTSTTPSATSTCVCDVGYKWSSEQKKCVIDCKSGVCSGPGQSVCSSCVYGTCMDGACDCWAGYSGSACDQSVPRQNNHTVLGTNIGGISYWTTEWAFVDVMKMSSSWVSQNYPGLYLNNPWDNGLPVHIRPDGYPAYLTPGQVVSKLMLRDVQLHAPSGTYVCLYDGDGIITFGFDARVLTTSKGRIEFSFIPTTVPGCSAAYCSDNGIYMTILETNISNPIHNIRVLMPGFEYQYEQFNMPFHPWFLKNLQYYSTIRYASWQNINSNHEVFWSNRTLKSFDTFTTSVPLEYMIQLSNVLGSNPWFCMPHQADDEYIFNFATMVKQNLRPDLKIYIELSNEVWNNLFSQGTFAENRGIALGLSTDRSLAKYRFYSQRSVEIFNIWYNVFGASASSRLVRVLSTWTISTYATTAILTWKNAYKHADMVAIAPYFDCGMLGSSSNAGKSALMSVSDVLATCQSSMSAVATNYVIPIVKLSRRYNLTIGTYEAGQSLVETAVMEYGAGETAGLTALFVSANRHPGMKDVYTSYIHTLRSAGLLDSHPLMHFISCGVFTKYGSWGTIEFTGQPLSISPKYHALLSYLNESHPFITHSDGDGNQYCVSDTSISPLTGLASGSGLGLSLGPSVNTFYGYPAVISPRTGDIWVVAGGSSGSGTGSGFSSSTHTVKWLVDGDSSSNSLLSIYLWESEVCKHSSSSSSTSAAGSYLLLGSNIPRSSGEYTFTLNNAMVFNSSTNYIIEIRSSFTSNFSEFFSIKQQYYLSKLSTHCCQNILLTSGTCNKFTSSGYSNALKSSTSSWKYANTQNKCPSNVQQLGYSQCVINSKGCREYRTTAHFKPVVDCVAQYSPFPHTSNSTWGLAVNVVDSSPTTCAPILSTQSCSNDPLTSTTTTIDPICQIAFPPKNTTISPTRSPSRSPSRKPTRLPTASPSIKATKQPSLKPSREPTSKPTVLPSRYPSISPTTKPSLYPTLKPTRTPTYTPTSRPSREPTSKPTLKPSSIPTIKPSKKPSLKPTTREPSSKPTRKPSSIPTIKPTRKPSSLPTLV